MFCSEWSGAEGELASFAILLESLAVAESPVVIEVVTRLETLCDTSPLGTLRHSGHTHARLIRMLTCYRLGAFTQHCSLLSRVSSASTGNRGKGGARAWESTERKQRARSRHITLVSDPLAEFHFRLADSVRLMVAEPLGCVPALQQFTAERNGQPVTETTRGTLKSVYDTATLHLLRQMR
jgi:hypothetical protein